MSEAMHIITMSPEEQLTLHLLSQNYLKCLAKMYITDSISGTSQAALDRWRKFCTAMSMVEDLTGSLPNSFTFEDASTKMFHFSPSGIKTIVKIVENFNPSNNSIEYDEALRIVDANVDELYKKLSDSARWTFTSDEIKTAMRKSVK